MLGHTCLQFGLGKPIGNTISALVLLLCASSISYVTSTVTVVVSPHHAVLKEGHEGRTNSIISCTTQLNTSVGMYFQSPGSKTSKEIYDRFELINGYKKMFNMTHDSRLPRHFTLSHEQVGEEARWGIYLLQQ